MSRNTSRVTFTPELYAAGVSIVGPSNIITLMNSIPPYWLPVKQMFMRRVGDPDDPEDRARLESQSPFFHAENIEAPLLIIQGANDPRVKKAESEQIVVRLRELERPVEYMLAPDEGHGFVGRENRLAMFARVESFFAEHLGGRAQEGMAPDVAARLAALNVNINDVQMPETVVADREAPRSSPRYTVEGTLSRNGSSPDLDDTAKRMMSVTASGAAVGSDARGVG